MGEEQNLTVWEGKEYAEIQKENPISSHVRKFKFNQKMKKSKRYSEIEIQIRRVRNYQVFPKPQD
jgi:hypothetical protein